ncbi:hypothetical protein [Alicyclobacillus sp.]|uniref:hypothetical protein n=1 Tax=Alicyclobacillus sp. TaxID=61169 RepID=UPI0025BE4219|nr:hypothetical protein [Alicyclobacillus sp.]MCL6516753.1 hypothetical protein [Alicyclobacillus sp.]
MGILDRISGKSIEDKVVEYSEMYGEIVLGLYRDLETLNQRVYDDGVEMTALAGRMDELQTDVTRLQNRVQRGEEAAEDLRGCVRNVAEALEAGRERLREIEGNMGWLNGQVHQVHEALAGLGKQLESFAQWVDTHANRLDAHGTRLQTAAAAISALQERSDEWERAMAGCTTRLDTLAHGLRGLEEAERQHQQRLAEITPVAARLQNRLRAAIAVCVASAVVSILCLGVVLWQGR